MKQLPTEGEDIRYRGKLALWCPHPTSASPPSKKILTKIKTNLFRLVMLKITNFSAEKMGFSDIWGVLVVRMIYLDALYIATYFLSPFHFRKGNTLVSPNPVRTWLSNIMFHSSSYMPGGLHCSKVQANDTKYLCCMETVGMYNMYVGISQPRTAASLTLRGLAGKPKCGIGVVRTRAA